MHKRTYMQSTNVGFNDFLPGLRHNCPLAGELPLQWRAQVPQTLPGGGPL